MKDKSLKKLQKLKDDHTRWLRKLWIISNMSGLYKIKKEDVGNTSSLREMNEKLCFLSDEIHAKVSQN